MALFIKPSGTVNLYSCPRLHEKSEDTIFFASEAAQKAYFNGKMIKSVSGVSYQSYEDNRIRVSFSPDNNDAETVMQCNYMSFVNGGFEGWTFYAFIDACRYINNVTVEITFTLDIIQTCITKWRLKTTFIERCHTSSDKVGEYILPEPVNLGDYVHGNQSKSNYFNEWILVCASAYWYDGSAYSGNFYHNMYSGLAILCFENVTDFNDYVQLLTKANHQDGIVALYMFPKSFTQDGYIYPDTALGQVSTFITKTMTQQKPQTNGNYTPRNNKLLTYPFCFLSVTSCDGQENIYRYEWFSTENVSFDIVGDYSPATCFLMIPKNYDGIVNNYNEALTMDKVPLCAWVSDAYQAWLAQNKTAIATTQITSLLGNSAMVAGGILSRNPYLIGTGIMGEFQAIHNMNQQDRQARQTPNSVHGSTSGGLEVMLLSRDFYTQRTFLTEEAAKSIDDFFDMFGYTIKEWQVPNLSVRQNWTYLKTVGLNISINAPESFVTEITSRFENGIRFWNNGDSIGEYSLPNRIT